VVAPLRISRTDTEVSYLSFGLAEAVSGSLAGLGNIVVRAPSVAAKWSEDNSDVRQLAAGADVDLVMSSTLLRAADKLRITAQLIDASSGTLLGSIVVRGSIDDVFALEDQLTNAAMTLLSPQLTVNPHRPAEPRREVPANPRAFELFLRGMEEARLLTGTKAAKELFQRAVEQDPAFAPAWAALGRAHRVWGKYYEDHERSYQFAEQAFARAFELSPDLPLAHRFYTHFESEHGRAPQAIVRLLQHASTNRQDAQLFAGLVHACRYAGLFDASVAAHDEANRLDPNVATGVEYTLAQLALTSTQAQERLLRHAVSADAPFVLAALGDPEITQRAIARVDILTIPPAFRRSDDAVVAMHALPAGEAVNVIEQAMAVHTDPEALFLFGAMLIRIDAIDRGLAVMSRAVRGGYAAAPTLEQSPSLRAVRDHAAFKAIHDDARQQMQAALQMFEAAGGPEMLGMPAATRLSN
jgi:TolB-like protein